MSCSSVKLWKGTVVAGYGTGQIRLYEAVTGILHAEVNAHARWIYSLDIAPFSGLVSCRIKVYCVIHFLIVTHGSTRVVFVQLFKL